MPQEVPPREQGTGASSEKGAFLSDFHFQPETSVLLGSFARVHCGSLTPSMGCGEAAFLLTS